MAAEIEDMKFRKSIFHLLDKYPNNIPNRITLLCKNIYAFVRGSNESQRVCAETGMEGT